MPTSIAQPARADLPDQGERLTIPPADASD
jgi:hypothetical protein